MTITRQEVRANREKWIAFLKEPIRRKAKHNLDIGGGKRCCLGHGCAALGMRSKQAMFQDHRLYYGQPYTPPAIFVDAVGLYHRAGRTGNNRKTLPGRFNALTDWNDETDATPQEIGAYLETVIEGGESTPFRPLTDYPEASS